MDKVFIFDLLALAPHPAMLSNCLASCFSSPTIFKIGLGLEGDCEKLCASYPAVTAFHNLAGVLELRSALLCLLNCFSYSLVAYP